MTDAAEWVGIGLTALGLAGGGIAYVHSRIVESDKKTDEKVQLVHERVSKSTEKAEAMVAEAKKDLLSDIQNERMERLTADEAERSERRREHDRLEGVVDSFRVVGTAVAGLVEGVKHIGERFDDYKKTNDRSLDEIKHGIRSMDAKVQDAANRGRTDK